MTPKNLLGQWAREAKETRIAVQLTQAELAKHAGVGLGLIKRFESAKGITLTAFLRIALALGREESLIELLRPPEPIPGLGVLKTDLAHMTIAEIEIRARQAQSRHRVRRRVRHKRPRE